MTPVDVRGAVLKYTMSGDGPPMIWGHGLSSSTAREADLGLIDWANWSGRVSLVRYDARGHGESESTPDLAGYHWRELALDQLALADRLGIDSYIAGGASMGAATALHAAVLAPQRVSALLLVIPPTAWATRSAQKANYEMLGQLVEDGHIDLIIAGSQSVPPPDPMIANPDWSALMENGFRNVDPVRLARIFRGAALTDLPTQEQIAQIRVPTLIMAWTGDAGHPISTAQRLVELMPHANLITASTSDQLCAWSAAASEFVNAQVI